LYLSYRFIAKITREKIIPINGIYKYLSGKKTEKPLSFIAIAGEIVIPKNTRPQNKAGTFL